MHRFIGILAGLTMLVATPAWASDHGLETRADTAYVVDISAGTIDVLARFVLANTLPDSVDAKGRTSYYFNSFAFPVPGHVDSVEAFDGTGRQLEVAMQASDGQGRIVTVAFQRLFFDESVQIDVHFSIPGVGPRSEVDTRVNPAFAWFTAWAYGDPGLSSVAISIPDGFEVDTLGSGLGEDLTARAIENPGTWAVAVSARRDDLLEHRKSGDVNLAFWPGDDVWADFVGAVFAEGVPILEKLIGSPWPDTGLVVLESSGPSLAGYAGWYLPAEGRIELGEELDAAVVLHEATHAWFNSNLFSDRWVNEGLAEVFAAAAMEATGSEYRPQPIPDDIQVFPLNTWPPADGSATDPYGYAASFQVMNALSDEVGIEGLSKAIASAMDGLTSYPVPGRDEQLDLQHDWRTFLDRLENVAGSTQSEGLFRAMVLTPSDIVQLGARSEARAGYQAFLDAIAGWGAPPDLRAAMATWDFTAVPSLIIKAQAAVATRVEVDRKANSLGARLPDGRELFETSNIATSQARYEAQLEVVNLLIAASDPGSDDPAFLESVGLIGADTSIDGAIAAFDAGDLSTAERLAREVISGYEAARDNGIDRILAAFALLSVFIGAAVGLRAIRSDA